MKQYLHWRDNRAYYRRRVPDDLVAHFGKSELKRALKTSDKSAAVAICAAEHARVEKEFFEIRERFKRANDNPDQLSTYSNGQMSALALKWLDRTEQKLLEYRVKEASTLSDEEVETLFVEAQMELQEIIDANARQDTGPGMTEGTILLEREGITFVRGSESYRRFGHYMNQAILTFHKNVVGDMRGHQTLQRSNRSDEADPAGISPILIEDLFQKYANDPSRQLNEKSRASHEFTARMLMEIVGKGVYAHNITRDDCENVLRLIKRIPTNASKIYPGLKLSEAADRAEREGKSTLAIRTINKYMQMLSSVLEYGLPHRYVAANVAKGMTLVDMQPDDEKRQPLTIAELNLIFRSPLYTGCKDDEHGFATPGPLKPRRHRFWLPLIAMFSAMRLNEICQLHAQDIQNLDGVWSFVLKRNSETGEKRLKTTASARFIPIHPELLKIGIIKYRDEMLSKGGGSLFPELPEGGKGYKSDYASKSVLRHFRNCGVVAKEAKKDMHSLRKGFNQLLQKKGVSEAVRNQLGGWTQERGIRERHYDAKQTPQELFDMIKDANYQGLNLSHLYEDNQ